MNQHDPMFQQFDIYDFMHDANAKDISMGMDKRYLRLYLKCGNFSEEEDDLIIKLHSILNKKCVHGLYYSNQFSFMASITPINSLTYQH